MLQTRSGKRGARTSIHCLPGELRSEHQCRTSGMLCRTRNRTLERPNHCRNDSAADPLTKPAPAQARLPLVCVNTGRVVSCGSAEHSHREEALPGLLACSSMHCLQESCPLTQACAQVAGQCLPVPGPRYEPSPADQLSQRACSARTDCGACGCIHAPGAAYLCQSHHGLTQSSAPS